MKRLARTDIAIHSRELLHQAIWCGVVFGLAALITTLNVLPPIEVQYLVSGKVLTSPTRAETLQNSLGQSGSIDLPSRLCEVKVLDSVGQHFPSETNVKSVLLGVESIWKNRCDPRGFQNWIATLSMPSESIVQKPEQAKEAQLVQWELDAARHYQSHHSYVGATSDSNSKADSSVFQLASTSSSADPSELVVKKQLDEKVRSLETRLTELNAAKQSLQDHAAGKVELTDDPSIQPSSRRIPGWMAMSVLVLGFAVGASAGWLQFHLQSGGIFDPNEVAEQLTRAGVPSVATVQLSVDQDDSTDWIALASQKASDASRKGGRNLILLSEGVLALWIVIILFRISTDSLWRSLLLESPLAALGRLLTGMP